MTAFNDAEARSPSEHRGPLWLLIACVVGGGLVLGGVLLLRRPPAPAPAPRSTAEPAKVDLGNLPLPAPPERVAPPTPQGPRAVDPVGHVYVGQTFEFVMQMTNPTMTITTTEVWTVRSIAPEQEVVYDTKTTTQMQMKNPPRGMPLLRPRTTVSRGQRYLLPSASRRNPRTRRKPVAEELLDVNGVEFECKVYLVKGTKSWVSEQFPGSIKMASPKMTRKLVKVSSPQ